MCTMRVTQPLLISCIISTMLVKAVLALALYTMDRRSPEISCRVNVIPSRNPMFHMKEIEEGEGRSARDFFSIIRIEFFFDVSVFI